jgi:hypothetical protein
MTQSNGRSYRDENTVVRNILLGAPTACRKAMWARENFDGFRVWCNRRTLPQDAQKGLPARPQPKNRPQAYPLGYVEDLFKARTKLEGFFSILIVLALTGCAASPYERRGNPQGLSQRDVERDYMECEYKARLANGNFFYNQGSPFPFSGGPQSPSDHARALHGISTINAMRDTCLAAKGYRVE